MSEETLFHEVLAKPVAERAAFLDAACAGQPQLRAAVAALLAAHEAPGSLLDRPAVEVGQTVDPAPDNADPPVATTDHHPQVAPGLVIAGRYTLVQKIGEGGMGEVWVARQTEPVKRKVALKLIKTGMDSRAVLTRFEQERQALALMDHPNIARVLDGGLTPTGQPFFVMELVNGLPLTRFCDEAKLTPKERLELFLPICQAVQHAHHKGIVHRDLKPANILVTLLDGRPVPRVIDFGLAKAMAGKLTDESLATQFGAVLGTLEYMAPEQAGFSSLDIDTRADIYSLGVILYELLTGLRPIHVRRLKKAALAEMVRIIQEEEPARPSTRLSTDESLPSLAALRQTDPKKLMAMLRGELDWVVMKCLEKQRDRRYETANGLARDIQRYLVDETVEARPPSAGYRLSKFLKRNKGPVLAASLLLLALLAGMAGTTVGLIRADQEAKNARLSAATAKQSEAKAIVARNDLEKVNTELQESSDRMLSGVARSLLLPLAVQVQPNQLAAPLNEQEIEPLWELASSPEERLRLRFVEEALCDPVLTRRLKDRSAFALQAAVGLDETRRTQVEALLGRRFQAKEIPAEQQEDVALCLAKLGIRDRALAGRTAATLLQAMRQTNDPFALGSLAEGLSAVAAHLEPEQGAEAAATLAQAMTRTTEPSALSDLARGLTAVSDRLEPKEAAQAYGQAAATLTQAMTQKEPVALRSLAKSLSAVAARLEPKEAAATLTQNMTRTTDPVALQSLAQALAAVSARLEPKEAAATLTQAMSKTTEPVALRSLAQALAAVAARLEPKQAAQAYCQAAAALTQAMSQTTEPVALSNLARGLAAVSSRLEPKEASATLTQGMTRTTDFTALGYLAQGLSAVAARLEPKEAAEAAATLTQAISKTTNPNTLRFLAESLSAVAACLEPKEAAQVCGQAVATLTQAINKTTDWNALVNLWQGLAAVSSRLEPKEAATLAQAITRTTEPVALQSLAQALAAVSARMEPKQAAQVCGQAAATLTQAMTRTTDPVALQSLAQALAAVADRLEPKEAAQACGQAAATLIQAMTRTTNLAALQSLAQGLSAILTRQTSTTSRDRLLGVTATIAALGHPGLPVAALAAAQPALEPLPSLLPPQMLVDLLKQPFCVGDARRVVLEQLSRHYQRPFADQWDFVDYVHQHKLDLDLTTPPQRPSEGKTPGSR